MIRHITEAREALIAGGVASAELLWCDLGCCGYQVNLVFHKSVQARRRLTFNVVAQWVDLWVIASLLV